MNNNNSKQEYRELEQRKPVHIIAWVILFLSLTITGIVVYNTQKKYEEQFLKDFTIDCNNLKSKIFSRLDVHAQVLWNGAALFEASDSVSRNEWKIFINHQRLEQNLPGIQGVGYALLISADDLPQHEKNIRKEGFSEYKIKPTGSRSIYSSIIYIEPFEGRNLRAFGYDMFAEPVRHAAMQQACDSNNAAMSGKVQLVQETETDIQAGVLMYVPIYFTNKPIRTIEERRKAIKGWVYSPYRMKELMKGIIHENKDASLNKQIDFQIFDGNSTSPNSLIYTSLNSNSETTEKQLVLTLKVNYNGTIWTIRFKQKDHFNHTLSFKPILAVFMGGISLSLLLFFLTIALLNSRSYLKTTQLLANRLNENLKKQIALFNAIPDAVFVSDKHTGKIEDTNNQALTQYGYTRNELNQMHRSDFIASKDTNIPKELTQYQKSTHTKKDTTQFPVEITRSTFEVNGIQKVISVVRDISERMLSERDLLIKNEAFENSLAAQCVFNRLGNISHANQSFIKMWGFATFENATGLHMSALFANSSEAEKILETINEHNEWQGEIEAIHTHNTIFICHGFASKILNSNKETIGYQATYIDITADKENEKSLLDYKIAINQAADGIAMVTLDRKITFSNTAWAKMHGYTSEELHGVDISMFHTTEQMHQEVEPHFEMLVKNENYSSEIGHKRKDGTIFPTWMSTSILKDTAGNVAGYLGVAQDITLRKAAEKELQNSKENYFRVVENSNDAILVSTEYEIVFANNRLSKILDYDNNEIQLTNYNELLHSDDQEELINKYMNLFKGEKLERVPARIITREGNIKWAEFSAIVIDWNNQTAVLSFVTDITERKKAQDALISSEELYKSTINASPDDITVTDLSGKITMASHAAVSLLGLKDNTQLIGYNFIAFLAKEERKRAKRILQQMLISDIRRPLEFKCKYSDGSIIETEINGDVIKDASGKPTGYVFVVRDIAERKKAQEALKESEEKWRLLVNNSPDFIALYDRTGKFKFLNRFAKGYSEKDLIDKNTIDFLPPESKEIYKAKIDECVEKFENIRFQHEGQGDKGTNRTYDVTLVPLLSKNNEIHILSVARDITESKIADNALKSALKEKEILLREVHHRVKNNLQVVSSLLNLQSRNSNDALLSESLMQSRNRIRSIALVHERLYQSGNFAEINIKEYTQLLVNELFRVNLTDPEKINIHTEIEDINIPLIYAIPCGLIINEIFSNSLKYAFPKDFKSKRKPEVFIKINSLPNNLLQFSLGDNGIGLPADYQISDSSSLGLYLIHILATEQLDGKLEIDNKKGTIFTITFNPFQK